MESDFKGIEMTGHETYAGIEACIMYMADRSMAYTYTYFKKVDGDWQPLADVINETTLIKHP